MLFSEHDFTFFSVAFFDFIFVYLFIFHIAGTWFLSVCVAGNQSCFFVCCTYLQHPSTEQRCPLLDHILAVPYVAVPGTSV